MKNGKASSSFAIVGWILLGLIIAGPNLPLRSQDSRAGGDAGKKRETTSIKPLSPPAKTMQPSPQAQKPLPEIILPDIYIDAAQDHSHAQSQARKDGLAKSVAPSDTLITLKRYLEKAERELEQLQRERSRIIKTLEKIKKSPAKGASSSIELTTGRPSV
jgi:hypothetical protein